MAPSARLLGSPAPSLPTPMLKRLASISKLFVRLSGTRRLLVARHVTIHPNAPDRIVEMQTFVRRYWNHEAAARSLRPETVVSRFTIGVAREFDTACVCTKR